MNTVDWIAIGIFTLFIGGLVILVLLFGNSQAEKSQQRETQCIEALLETRPYSEAKELCD